MKKQLEFNDGKSSKFWRIEQEGNAFTVTYGKTGSAGQSQNKQFANETDAQKEALKLINSKLKKGYAEVDCPAESAVKPTDTPAKTKQTAQSAEERPTTVNAQAAPELTESAKADIGLRYFEFDDGKSGKFWSLAMDGDAFSVRYGKTGANGQLQEKSYSTQAEAEKEAAKMIKSKTNKGYVEKAAPDYIINLAQQAKPEPIPMPEAPKPKVRVLPAPGPEAIDDGSPRAWAKDREEYEEDIFALDFLRTPEVIDVKTKAEKDIERSPKPAAGASVEGYDEKAFGDAKSAFLTAIKRGRSGLNAAALIDNMKKARPSEQQLKDAYIKALDHISSDDFWALSLHHLEALPIMAAEIDIINDYAGKKSKAHAKNVFGQICLLNPSPQKMAGAIDKVMTGLYQKAAEIALGQLREVVENIKAGKQKHINGKKLPVGETGFMIDVDDTISIYTAIGRDRLCRTDFKDGDDISASVIKRYLSPLLKPELEKLADAGFFDEIADGYIWIGLYSDREAIVERRVDEKMLQGRAAEVETNLRLLETTDDFIGNAELLKETVDLYLRNNGIVVNKDDDRILAVLTRFLYSGEERPEKVAFDLINHYDYFDYSKWNLELIKFSHANFDYKQAKDRLEMLIKNYDYAPAKEKMKEWDFAVIANADDDQNGVDYEKIYGYGGAANAAHHRDVFSENDVFVETDTIIARALSDGHIYIRFKKEGEQGYSDALDWLNRLMEKGYSNIHDGYDLNVRFLAEPIFFEEFRSLMDAYMWPDNDSHAFFCKAVRYPALRDKVAEFARLTLQEYDRYLSLDGEYSTVAGTFAAVAAVMSDLKYMDVAIQYGEETDGEHEEMASHFADILEDYWGLAPETAVAIAVLTMSYDHDNLGLSEEYYKIPQLLEAVMNYFISTRMHHKSHKIMRLAQNIFLNLEEGDEILKKLKKLFKDASDPRAKRIYADFYNLYLEALIDEEGDEFGSPLDYKAPAAKAPTGEIIEEALPENPPCVITPAEAKTRGYRDEEFENIDDAHWCALIFAPLTITNPYIYDFFKANRLKRIKIDPDCYTVRNPCKCYTFGKKAALDLTGAPYQFGMIVYDKKEAAILYGLYDYAEVAAKLGKKKIDLAQMQALKQKHYFTECPKGTPVEPLSNPAVKLLDEAHDAVMAERYMRAVMKLEKITPQEGDVYDASLLLMADMMAIKGDKKALRRVYETAQSRLPQYSDYWQSKLAVL